MQLLMRQRRWASKTTFQTATHAVSAASQDPKAGAGAQTWIDLARPRGWPEKFCVRRQAARATKARATAPAD
eukprot:10159976-Alexandrium_andersonii.AAC.1